MAKTGVVVIGRNEGERLRRCLVSLLRSDKAIVYVDSGSSDGSVAMAEGLGVIVAELDLNVPFTAARARNRGADHFNEHNPDLDYVQFVDGDCEVDPLWIPRAERALESNPALAVVCGRRRERSPDASVYNRLCDIEWNTPIGKANACGGDAMIRFVAFREVLGFDEALIAGEEPDLCLRLRRRGWLIERLDAEMTLHDAAMTRFSQWWKRSKRSGYAYAEGRFRHAKSPEKHWVRETRSGIVLGGVLPLIVLVTATVTHGKSVIALGAYVVVFTRSRHHMLRRGFSAADASLYAAFCVLSKFPEVFGQASFWTNQWTGRRSAIIEYKTS